MPKKTKRQKMAAEKRKIHHFEFGQNVAVEEPEITKPMTKNPVLTISDTSTEIFKKDLSRSLFISITIILVEIGIYLAQNKVIPITNLIQ